MGFQQIQGLSAVYSSDMIRAQETARIICGQAGLATSVNETRLRERSVGEWSGLTYNQVQRRWPGYLKRRLLPPSLVNARVTGHADAEARRCSRACSQPSTLSGNSTQPSTISGNSTQVRPI
ncbi:hypothetical protein T484DRAFT_1889206 [Baffinella frigidus]|nr:hypothetical protein T484DRAFT_1889206 [Cryptophyta sp. CCMP2293]